MNGLFDVRRRTDRSLHGGLTYTLWFRSSAFYAMTRGRSETAIPAPGALCRNAARWVMRRKIRRPRVLFLPPVYEPSTRVIAFHGPPHIRHLVSVRRPDTACFSGVVAWLWLRRSADLRPIFAVASIWDLVRTARPVSRYPALRSLESPTCRQGSSPMVYRW